MFRLVIFTLILYRIVAKSCSGHDGCKNQVFTDHSLTCNGGERCCKNVAMTCTSGMACDVKIKGGGHDQFQDSEVFAQEATSLDVSCAAGGLRECKNTKIFCPTTAGSTCKCTGCVSSTKMYCPHGVTCTSGGATLVNMNKYFCKGTGSNVYCNDPTYKISMTCPSNVPDVCISTVMSGSHYSVTCAKGTSYERPRCPEYYQDRYDNVKYHQINVTRYEDAALPLEQLCKASIPPKDQLLRPKNRGFQINSWNSGCQKRKETLSDCKAACRSPQGCCGSTCAWNHCSGGSCCSASSMICQSACDFMFSPQVYNVIPYINVTNKTRWINTTRYINRTRWINTTRYINTTRWINTTRYINTTRWINTTRYIRTRWINTTRYINRTRWINTTRYINRTRWINTTRHINRTRWINTTRHINRTRWFNRTIDKYIYKNKTRWVNLTVYRYNYTNKTRWVNLTVYRYNYTNKTRWINRTIDRYIYKNKTRWFNRTIDVFIDRIRWINRTKISTPEVKTFWVNRTRVITKTRWVNLYKTKYVYENKIRWTNRSREKIVYKDKVKLKEEPKFYMGPHLKNFSFLHLVFFYW